MSTAASIRKTPRENQINIRATDEERAVIDYAASTVNKNRTDFIIELAYQKLKTSFWINVYLYWITNVMIRLLRNWKLLYRMQKGVNV